jgi:hypothetical protein
MKPAVFWKPQGIIAWHTALLLCGHQIYKDSPKYPGAEFEQVNQLTSDCSLSIICCSQTVFYRSFLLIWSPGKVAAAPPVTCVVLGAPASLDCRDWRWCLVPLLVAR